VLLSPARQVRTREELIDLLWPDRTLSDSRTLDTHVHRLRTKLEPDPTSPRYIVTVRGVGFRIDPEGTRSPPPPADR
jgi:two-component system response regulator RegX3